MKIVFLDIDGVLNGHDWHETAKSNRIRYQCVQQLNRIVAETDCHFVLSSAWRYMIHGGALTLTGFEYLMRTHGAVGFRLLSVTPPDEGIPERGDQILSWLEDNKTLKIQRYVAIDDEDFGIVALKIPFVKTDGGSGLLACDADKVIGILNQE